MRLIHYLIVAALLAGMVFAGGCTSGTKTPPAPTTLPATMQTVAAPPSPSPVPATGEENYTALLSGLMLQKADLPADFSIYWEGELRIPEGIANPLEFEGGYDLNANRLISNDTVEEVTHTIAVFKNPPDNLTQVFTTLYPQLATNSSLTRIPVPAFGDASIGYIWEMPKGSFADSPDTSVSGALILFRHNGTIEMVQVVDSNTTANRTLVLDMAAKAAAKLPDAKI